MGVGLFVGWLLVGFGWRVGGVVGDRLCGICGIGRGFMVLGGVLWGFVVLLFLGFGCVGVVIGIGGWVGYGLSRCIFCGCGCVFLGFGVFGLFGLFVDGVWVSLVCE